MYHSGVLDTETSGKLLSTDGRAHGKKELQDIAGSKVKQNIWS